MVRTKHLVAILLISTITVEVNSQYIDFFQDLQALFQPLQYGSNGPRLDATTRRPATRKNTDRRPNKHNENIPFAVTQKNDREFSSTTPKPSRKPARVQPSQNRPTTNNPFNEYLKSVNNIFTTTSFNFNNNKNEDLGSNNYFERNNARLTTEKTNASAKDNTRRRVENNNTNRGSNNKNINTNNKLVNSKITAQNPAANYEINRTPNNNLNDKVSNIDRGRPNSDKRVTDVNAIYFEDNNEATSNPNRGTNNNFVVTDNNRPAISFTIKNPLNNQNIRPTTNNFGNNNFGSTNRRPNTQTNAFITQNPLLNAPPITNIPATESNVVYSRPTNPGAITFTDQSDISPDLEIGPNEDDMTEAEKRRYVEIAEEMCDVYKSLNVKKVVALPLIPQPQGQGVEFNVSDCKPINIPLIIGGKVSSIEEYPHMALVGWMKIQRNAYSWKCGGSLISDQYILTAGHCTFYDKDDNIISGPPHAVQLGSARIDDPAALVVRISSVIRHPKYKQRRSYHDVALIRMNTRVTFSKKIRPACLGVPPAVGKPFIATGWGRTEFGGDQSKELRSVSLPIWDMQDCKEIWGTSLKLPNGPSSDSQVCAGDSKGGKDTCQGDSGGPAQIQDGCVWRVIAVTSYGRSCGAPDTPALYATIPKAFVAAQVFGIRKDNFGNTNQQNDNRSDVGKNNRNGDQQLNGNGNRNNNQPIGNRFNNRQQTGDKNNNQQLDNTFNNQQQVGVRNNNRQQIGNSNNNQQQVGDRNNNQQSVENIYNNPDQLGNRYPNQQQQLGAKHFNQQLGSRYNNQEQSGDRSTNTQQIDNRYNQQNFGSRYDSQQRFEDRYNDQRQFGDGFNNQRQFGDGYNNQRQFGDRENNQHGLEIAYDNQQTRWKTNDNNNNKDINGYRVTERPWWSQ